MDILTVNDTPGEYPGSYYAATAVSPGAYPSVEGEVGADVCVVGGGFTGLSAALHLARRGMSVALIEASRVGFGASGRNGGQVGTGQRVDQRVLEKMVGLETARILWDAGLDAVALVKDLVAESGLDCSLTPGIIHADHKRRFAQDHIDYVEHMSRVYDYDLLRYLDKDALAEEVGSPVYHSGSLDMGGAHIHPLNYIFALAKLATDAGVRLYEKSRMVAYEKGGNVVVKTEQAEIKARYLLLALNGYHNNIEREISRYVMPINNFIVATEPLTEAMANSLIPNNYAVVDSKFVVNYFRLSPDRRMIFGGGESYGYRFPGDIKTKVRKIMLKIFPQLSSARIDYGWGGTLAVTRSRLPQFRKIESNILSCAGFSGHGVAMGTMAGKISADAVCGQAGKFDIFEALPNAAFPGGSLLRTPLSAAAMTWYALRDRL